MFEYILVTEKSDLAQHKLAIQDLFKECFDKQLDEELWDWGYIDNVCGSPIVSLCYSDSRKLIGHYAVIPITLYNENIDSKFMLSMTTMVHKDFRRHGLFVKQAGIVYTSAYENGYSYIYGFPNKNSLPGFKKRLGWNIDDDYVALVNKEQLLNSEKFNFLLESVYDSKFDISNSDVVNWRLSKPNASYIKQDGLIVKEYGGTIDVVYMDKNAIDKLDDGAMYHILIDGSIPDFLDSKVFSYPFGYLPLTNEKNVLKIQKDLLLSDVF